MFKIASRTITKITPQQATEILKKNTYLSQRSLYVNHVANLCSAIKHGEFHTGEIVLAKNGDGNEHLLNGQHQLNACVAAGMPIHVVMVKADCKTAEDMANLFSQYDVNKGRSIKDIVDAEVNSMGVEWYAKTGSLLAAALSVLMKARSGETKRAKAERVRKYFKEGNFVNQFLTTENSHLKRSPVVAAMVATFWKDKAAAQDFWAAVATGEMLKKNDPRLRLRTYLCSATIDTGTGGATKKECRAKCHHAWNAWRNGNTTALKYYADKPIPALV